MGPDLPVLRILSQKVQPSFPLYCGDYQVYRYFLEPQNPLGTLFPYLKLAESPSPEQDHVDCPFTCPWSRSSLVAS